MVINKESRIQVCLVISRKMHKRIREHVIEMNKDLEMDEPRLSSSRFIRECVREKLDSLDAGA